MKRILIVLLCLCLAASFSGCGSLQDPALPEATVADSAVESEEPLPTPGPDFTEQLAYISNICCIYLYTEMEDGTQLTRFDFNGDDIDDWLVYKPCSDPHGAWLLLAGGDPYAEADVVFDRSAAGDVRIYYSPVLDCAIVNKFFSTAGYSMSDYIIYDGQPGDLVASSTRQWLFSDFVENTYQVLGSDADSEKLQDYINSLELCEPGELQDVGGWTQFDLDVQSGDLDIFARQLSELPFVWEYISGDIDGDGVLDYYYLIMGDVCGIDSFNTEYYEGGSSLVSKYKMDDARMYGNSAMLLLSNNGDTIFKFEDDSYENRVEMRELNSQSMDMLQGIEEDGDYVLTLYADMITEKDGGWLAYAEMESSVTIPDDELRAALGDKYEISYGEGYQDIYVDDILSYTRGDDSDPWYVLEDAIVVSKTVGRGYIFVPGTSTFEDSMSLIMFGLTREVHTLPELFAPPDYITYPYGSSLISVSGGEITNVTLLYSP